MIFILLQISAFATITLASMKGHHHHHHHHGHGGRPHQSAPPQAPSDDADDTNPKFDMGMLNSFKHSQDGTGDEKMPKNLQGLAAAANSGNENDLMASIQQMTMSQNLPKEGDLHIKSENGEAVYDLRGVFKTQTAPPLKRVTMPPPIDWKTTTTTTTSTTVGTTANQRSNVQPAAAKSTAQTPVQHTVAKPAAQSAIAKPVAQPAAQ